MEGNGMVWGSGENGWLHKMISETILGQVNVWRKLRMKKLGISRWFVLPLTSSSYYGQRPHHLLRCGWLMTTERLRANLKTGKKTWELQQIEIWIIRYTDEPIEYAPWGDARPYDGGFRYNCMMIQVPCHRHLYHNVIIIDYHTQHLILSIIIHNTIDSFVFNNK